MSDAKSPSFQEQFHEGKSAYELVLGAMLGGYLGLTISNSGLSGGTYFDLGVLLVLTCTFVLMTNLAGERFHRRNYRFALLYGICALIGGGGAYSASKPLEVDGGILLTIFAVWVFLMGAEMMTALPAHRELGKHYD